MSLQHTLFHARRRTFEFLEDQWFDRTHHVHTAGDLPLSHAGIRSDATRDSELYVPARPTHVRQALSDAPIASPDRYHYVDLGSGKGRTLFIAAELPFHSITGVEFSPVLHQQAAANIRSFHFGPRHGENIHSVHQNALDFHFPDQPLVLYLFNPFGRDTMTHVLAHLQDSLAAHPRHTIVILLWPRCADLVARVAGMQEVCHTPHHHIFQAYPSIAPALPFDGPPAS